MNLLRQFVIGTAVVLLGLSGGCQSIREMLNPPEEAGKANSRSDVFSLSSKPRRPPSMLEEELSAKEQEVLRSHEREGDIATPTYGPGVYDKDSRGRKDWVFGR